MDQCRRQSYHGFLSEDKEFFRSKEVDDEIDDHAECTTRLKAHKKTVPLYIGRTTGLCGSLTFLSTFIRDVFLALANDPPMPFGPYSHASLFATSPAGTSAPNGGFNFMAILAVLSTEIGLSLAGLMLGAHIAIFLTSWTPPSTKMVAAKSCRSVDGSSGWSLLDRIYLPCDSVATGRTEYRTIESRTVAEPNAIFFGFCACWLFGTFFPVITTQRPDRFFSLGDLHSEREQGYDSRYGLFSAARVDKFVCPGWQLHWLTGSGRYHGRILRLSYNHQCLCFGII